MRHIIAAGTLVAFTLVAGTASGFCGFYVSGADDTLYNKATRVNLLRDGKLTALSMQNNYQGPPKDFAMVVPVPVVLKKKQVKTLSHNVFSTLDRLTAPRLVEYWERDPCARPKKKEGIDAIITPLGAAAGSGSKENDKVQVEAEFEVGEYEIVVLSSSESTALETWLTQNNYKIPKGAAAYFKPYVQKGQYFFVAKVDIDKVRYDDGEAVLSPLRFHYESDEFTLPVRLGLINSKGAQDLIVTILSPNDRYEVANLPNVTIPTNITVDEKTKKAFGVFYTQLFDNVLLENPRAVVTEYTWNLSFKQLRCDPCPSGLDRRDMAELAALGTDIVERRAKRPRIALGSDWVITRLHTRYSKHTLGEDLVFQKAAPIAGGNGLPQGKKGQIKSSGAAKASRNRFQGRYIIRHPWEGDVDCENPRRGRWGGPNSRGTRSASPLEALGFQSNARSDGLADFVVDQERIEGLEKPVSKYEKPAADVMDSWGKLVEPPEPDTGDDDTDDDERPDEDTRLDDSATPFRPVNAGFVVLLTGLGLAFTLRKTP
jgi:hypothetical protein